MTRKKITVKGKEGSWYRMTFIYVPRPWWKFWADNRFEARWEPLEEKK